MPVRDLLARGISLTLACLGALLSQACVSRQDALIRAAVRGDAAQAGRLLGRGADPNYRKPGNGETPLMAAAQGGHLEVAKLLLEKGADTSLKSNSGETAFEIATKNGRHAVRDLLAGRKGDPAKDAEDAPFGHSFVVVQAIPGSNQLSTQGYWRIADGRPEVYEPGAVLVVADRAGLDLDGTMFPYGAVVVVDRARKFRLARPGDEIGLRQQMSLFGKTYGPGLLKVPADGKLAAAGGGTAQ